MAGRAGGRKARRFSFPGIPTSTVPSTHLSCTVCTAVWMRSHLAGLEVIIGSKKISPQTVAALRSKEGFALRIIGDAMLPIFRAGDTVIIDPMVTPAPGDFVVAMNRRSGLCFRQFRCDGSLIELVSLNPAYLSIRSDVTPIMIVGTMVEHRRGGGCA